MMPRLLTPVVLLLIVIPGFAWGEPANDLLHAGQTKQRTQNYSSGKTMLSGRVLSIDAKADVTIVKFQTLDKQIESVIVPKNHPRYDIVLDALTVAKEGKVLIDYYADESGLVKLEVERGLCGGSNLRDMTLSKVRIQRLEIIWDSVEIVVASEQARPLGKVLVGPSDKGKADFHKWKLLADAMTRDVLVDIETDRNSEIKTFKLEGSSFNHAGAIEVNETLFLKELNQAYSE